MHAIMPAGPGWPQRQALIANFICAIPQSSLLPRLSISSHTASLMSVCEVGPEPWKYSKNLSFHNTLGNQPTPFMYRKKAPSTIL